jgi:hypothetical protein
MWRRVLRVCASSLIFAAAVIALAEGQQQRNSITAPDGQHSVEILHTALPGSDPYNGFFTITVQVAGHVLSRYPTDGYLPSAYWSPNGRFVAVNNRRGTYGDYVWVFRLNDGHALKQPSDALPVPGQPMYSSEALLARVRAKFPEYRDAGYYKFGARAERWTAANELEIVAVVTFTHIDNDLVRIFDTYAISEDGLRLIRTHMTKERQNA